MNMYINNIKSNNSNNMNRMSRSSLEKAIKKIQRQTLLYITSRTHKTITFGSLLQMEKDPNLYQISASGWARKKWVRKQFNTGVPSYYCYCPWVLLNKYHYGIDGQYKFRRHKQQPYSECADLIIRHYNKEYSK